MNEIDLEKLILNKLYDAYFNGTFSVVLKSLSKEIDQDNTLFWNSVDHLTYQGYIKTYSLGGSFIICPRGIVFSEDNNIGSQKMINENQKLRTIVLDKLAKVYEDCGSLADIQYRSASEELGVDTNFLMNNIMVLENLGYVEFTVMGSFKITYEGLELVKDWRKRSSFSLEYEEISKLEPQPRGYALQKLLAKVIEYEGWIQEEGTRTSHEEMDVVIHKDREYFLIESKWEKNAIEARIIRELFGKLSNRIGVQGIIVSMSGFTSGAIDQVKDYVNHRVILFFGNEDVKNLIYQNKSFDTLLGEKYHQLITVGEITFL